MSFPLSSKLKGRGTAFHAADMGILTLEVSSTVVPTKEEALKMVQDTTDALAAKFREHGWGGVHADPTAAIASFVVLVPAWTKATEIYAYPPQFAQAEFEVTFRDIGMLAQIASDMVRMPRVTIKKAEWRLSDKTRWILLCEARKKAVEDATEQAKYSANIVHGTATAIDIADCTSPKDQSCGIDDVGHPVKLQVRSGLLGQPGPFTDAEVLLTPRTFKAVATAVVTFVSTSARFDPTSGVVEYTPSGSEWSDHDDIWYER